MDKIRKRFSALSTGQKQPPQQAAAAAQPPAESSDARTNATTAAATVAPAGPASAATVPAAEQAPPAPPAKDTAAVKAEASDATPDDRSYLVKQGLRTMYPPVEAFKTGTLSVDETHTLSYDISGNKDGVPVVFLHGGPGGGTSDGDRQFFDPAHYCIYKFDQRGSGLSTPHASLENNTTWHLVDDIEKLRTHFNVERWHVFGGSWGSCLSLAYAQKYPDRVLSLVLRGIFTLRRSELLFLYQDGTSHLFPEYFLPYLNHIPKEEQGDLMQAYYKRLTSDDESVRLEAAKHWSTLENASSKLYISQESVSQAQDDAKWTVAFARIESHYFVNKGWMDDGQLLKKENVDKIRHIPAVIVQGRYDVVCPPATAYKLHQEWPEAEFHMVPDSGHGSREPGILHKLIEATDKMRSIKP